MTSITIILGVFQPLEAEGARPRGRRIRAREAAMRIRPIQVHFKTGFTDSDPETTEEYELEVITHRKLQLTL